VITEGVNNAIRAAAPVANIKVNTTNQPNALNNNNNNNNINNNGNGNGNGRGNRNRNPFSPPLL